MMAPRAQRPTYPEIGVPEPHHSAVAPPERRREAGEADEDQTLPRRRCSPTTSRSCKSTPDGDGSLLDHIMLIYGSGMSDSNVHDFTDCRSCWWAAAAGQLKGGRHLRYPDGTPLTNLYLTVLNKLGVPVERVGDSTGQVAHLFEHLSPTWTAPPETRLRPDGGEHEHVL